MPTPNDWTVIAIQGATTLTLSLNNANDGTDTSFRCRARPPPRRSAWSPARCLRERRRVHRGLPQVVRNHNSRLCVDSAESMLLSAVNCWLKCMTLDPYNQTDNPECKSRPDSGLSAITELDPGYITGPLSSVWKEWVKWCIEFGIEANSIIAAPYDWRLSPSKLEERDLYFHKLKLTFETALKLRGGPSLVLAHSLGNNVFRYFLEWLKLEIPPKQYIKWLDEHIHAYFAVGSPFLGATQTVKATLSGETFGLPVSEGTARSMFSSFGLEAYPSVSEVAHNNFSSIECGLPTQLSFSAREISDGTFFKAIEDYDPESKRLLHLLEKSYHGDPVLNPLTPWDRPPIKNIFCIYGIDSKTEVGYYFAPSGKPYPDNWIITDVIYEIEGSLFSRSGNLVEGNPGPTSGDETVPYHSLSWCKNWLGPKVNITRAPQSEHDGSDIQVELNVEHQDEADIVPNMTRSPRVKYITYYEDSESIPGRKTAVWELDKANHRNIVRSPVLMREVWLQMWHDTRPDATLKFVTKAKRGPLRDEDCYWDYGKARCAWPEYCEYRL
ncbi:phospholipid--sterol O-acyltransferase [Citrus sinensis]|uniref:Phospholipid--sterol O-acyltransferase n=1 Tax=Citrus sinensis TaxID=2711 RepID=A0ACB8MII7_CITSI|nr:phospholipid--sterol O-acyltransferase [Citrus sinensis]